MTITFYCPKCRGEFEDEDAEEEERYPICSSCGQEVRI